MRDNSGSESAAKYEAMVAALQNPRIVSKKPTQAHWRQTSYNRSAYQLATTHPELIISSHHASLSLQAMDAPSCAARLRAAFENCRGAHRNLALHQRICHVAHKHLVCHTKVLPCDAQTPGAHDGVGHATANDNVLHKGFCQAMAKHLVVYEGHAIALLGTSPICSTNECKTIINRYHNITATVILTHNAPSYWAGGPPDKRGYKTQCKSY